MKQFKHKKFIGLALLVFLVFMVLGKYTQSTAFTSSSRVYATTVVDKNTGNKVRFEVRKIKGCLLYTSPSPRDGATSRMPSSA